MKTPPWRHQTNRISMYTRCRLARARRSRQAVIISQAEAPKIEATLHPVRWGLIVGLAIPILLLLSFLVAKGAGQNALAHYAIRCVRYFAGLELVALLLLATLGLLYEQRA